MYMKNYSKILLAMAFSMVLSTSLSAKTIYVTTTGSNANTGLSWASPKQSIAQAMTIAADGDEVWVKAGTYTQIAGGASVTTKISIYGGFVGTETVVTDRNWVTNKTILNNTGTATNSRHFLVGSTGDATNFILDGFTLQNGTSNAGGAISFSGSLSQNMIVRNCIFRNNRSTGNNGTISLVAGNSVSFYNCLFENNEAADKASVVGNLGTCNFYNCTFVNNKSARTADGAGTVMFLGSSGSLVNCIVWNNRNSFDNSLSSIGGLPNPATNVHHVASDLSFTGALNTIVLNQTNNNAVGPNFKNVGASVGYVADVTTLDALDYSLASASPCINIGDNTAVVDSYDLAMISRKWNTTVDLGTYESSDVSSGECIVSSNTKVNSITVAPGTKLTVNSGQTLTATNGITLQSDATGTATMLNSGTYSGNITAQQYLGSARNWYVTSPVASAPSPSNNMDYYYEYVEAGNNNPAGQSGSSTVYWKGLANGTNMEVGKGYIAKTNAGGIVQFSGIPNDGNITTNFNLTRNDAKGKGFNLVGNPYPSYIDWTLVAAANTNLDNSYYYRTQNNASGYTFVTWNGAGSTYVVSNGTLPVSTTITRYIPSTQAFWVRVKSGIASTAMNFTNSMRSHRDDNGNLMKAPKRDVSMSFRLQLINGSESDEMLVYQDAAASNNYDTYDSPKMLNNSGIVPDLYSKANDERLVINGLNIIGDNTELPLGFSLNAAATLKFKATELNNLPEGAKVFLRDNQENIETELTPGTEYVFSITTATLNNESRFSLIFKVTNVSNRTINTAGEQISVFVNTQNKITIIAKPNSNYTIYNALGQLIENGNLNAKHETRNNNFAAGVYLVKVNNQSTRVIVK